MGFIGRFLITTLAVIIAAYLLPGIELKNNFTPLVVALVLGLLNTFIRPVLVFLSMPITLVTFGLFLLVINTIIIKFTSSIVESFHVESWWAAFWFSIVLSLVTFVLESLIGKARES